MLFLLNQKQKKENSDPGVEPIQKMDQQVTTVVFVFKGQCHAIFYLYFFMNRTHLGPW